MTSTLGAMTDISNDFDFLAGTWDVEHDRPLTDDLTGGLVGSRAAAYRFLDGGVSLDEITFPSSGSSGLSVRVVVPERGEWEIRWVSSHDGLVGPPVVGSFEDGPGGPSCRLVGDELPQDGRPTRMTYEWDRITPTSARWQQAYSFDGERTWEKNWEMRFTRTADGPEPMPQDHLPKHTSDFDFLTGTWHVQHHKLRSRLTGCTDWDDFESTFDARTHLNGLVSVDEGALTGVDGAPYRGMTFRTYDVAAGEWRLHWFDSRSLGWDTAPVRGRFVDGVGEFVAGDRHDGVPILCRFRWTVHSPEKAGWEQAFSTDDGATWEVNWEMVETRIA
jgi:hypothetical protein